MNQGLFYAAVIKKTGKENVLRYFRRLPEGCVGRRIVGMQVSEIVLLREPEAFGLGCTTRNNYRRNTTVAGTERRTHITRMRMVIGGIM